MALNDKDFYASYGLDFDYKSMMDEYIKGVINQAKIEVLAEIQQEIEGQCKKENHNIRVYDYNNGISACYKIIQSKIDKLKKGGNENVDKG